MCTSTSLNKALFSLLFLAVLLGVRNPEVLAQTKLNQPPRPPENHVPFPDLNHKLAVDFLRSELSKVGADTESYAVHLIVGFSTSHFADDPRHAEAMVRVAKGVIREFLVNGDSLTSVGWEMDVWKEIWKRPYRYESERELTDLWPKTPKEGSQGGHDYNRSLIHVLRKLKQTDPESRDYAILFLCPHPYSQTEILDSSGKQVVGEDNPELLQLRQEMDASPWKSIEIIFTDSGRKRRICLALVTPNQFIGRKLLEKTRAELVSEKKTAHPKPAQPKGPAKPEVKSGGPWWLLILLVIAILIAILLRPLSTSRTHPVLSVTIGNSSEDFTGPWHSGQHLRTYAGPSAEEDEQQKPLRDQALSPSLSDPILRIEAVTKDSVRIVPLSGLKLLSNSGKEFPSGHQMKVGDKERMRIRGTLSGKGVPLGVDLEIDLELKG